MSEIGKNRASIKDEEFDGDLIPNKKDEISREVRISRGSEVRGGVYGKEITVEDSKVIGPIMASGGIEINNSETNADLGSKSHVKTHESTIKGSITAKKVNVESSIILGNVIGKETVVKDSIILGTVNAERNLEIRDSICTTFNTGHKAVLEDAKLIIPQAIAEKEVKFINEVEIVSIKADGKYPRMNEKDLYTKEGKNYLTLAPRLVNLEKVMNELDEIEKFIKKKVGSDKAVGSTAELDFDEDMIRKRLNEEILEVKLN